VKSVAGYDLPRLLVGAEGTLGAIVQATLRLWPTPSVRRWLARPLDGDRDEAVRTARDLLADPRRPWSIVLTAESIWLQLAGDVAADPPPGFGPSDPPPAPGGLASVAVSVPPPAVAATAAQIDERGLPHRAQVGVGMIEVGADSAADVAALRALAEGAGGHWVVRGGPKELREPPFGPAPAGLDMMRRLRDAFDPARILNPGLGVV